MLKNKYIFQKYFSVRVVLRFRLGKFLKTVADIFELF